MPPSLPGYTPGGGMMPGGMVPGGMTMTRHPSHTTLGSLPPYTPALSRGLSRSRSPDDIADDDIDELLHSGHPSEPFGYDRGHGHGSVGEWLQSAATPLEKRHFVELIGMLDDFEQRCGLANPNRERVDPTGKITLTLGPSMNLEMRFVIT